METVDSLGDSVVKSISQVLRDKRRVQERREHNINNVLRYNGLSVIIRTEEQFNHIKKFLSEDILYLNFVEQMKTKPTGVIIWSDDKDMTTGSVGCVENQRNNFFRVVEFDDFFKLD